MAQLAGGFDRQGWGGGLEAGGFECGGGDLGYKMWVLLFFFPRDVWVGEWRMERRGSLSFRGSRDESLGHLLTGIGLQWGPTSSRGSPQMATIPASTTSGPRRRNSSVLSSPRRPGSRSAFFRSSLSTLSLLLPWLLPLPRS